MTQPKGVVVPPASIRRPLVLALVFGALFAWSVSALVSNWTFSPALRDDLLVAALGVAAALTGVVFYMALGAVILDVGQPQLTVNDKGIKSPAYPLFGWSEILGAELRDRGGLLSRHDSALVLTFAGDAPGLQQLSLLQRLRQRRSIRQGAVVLTGQGWDMTALQPAIESHLAWYRHRSEAMERKLVRYVGGRVGAGDAGQRVA
ncbi:hypothetical protein H0Z60_10690 [Ectothiorhodospiraceae bacterium WFHF3C12]|nr:hypothetical protein [Ectothiorhodospiraceae bacterium WFHF3C12]